jgi:DNA-binding transcriptional regulator YhcF (GntR family)
MLSKDLKLMYRVRVSDNNRLSKVQQIVGAFANDIENGVLKTGARLPSINEFSEFNGVARDTIEKAYARLKASGYIASYPGRGYFVLDRKKNKTRLLLVCNRLNVFNKTIYDLLQESLGRQTNIDICIHHGNAQTLGDILETNWGKYDYYAVLMNFRRPVKLQELKRTLDTIPQRQLILLGKHAEICKQETNLIYQDFREDFYQALVSSETLLKKYKYISIISSGKENYSIELIEGIKDYCAEQRLRFKFIGELKNEELSKQTVYVVEEEHLARLIKKLRNSNLVIGKDIGIICLQENAFAELLDITVFATDFRAIRDAIAAIIFGKKKCKLRNPFYFVQRLSL